MAAPSNILQGTGCPVCVHKTIGNPPEYKNSIWASEHKEYFSQYLTEDQMKQYMPHSNKKINVKCPYCQTVKQITINNLFNEGFSCNMCGDAMSFANKFVFNVLSQLKVNIKTEYSPAWANKKRYDDYLIDYETIIENHGIQHYEDCKMTARTLDEEQANDHLKQYLAMDNDIKHYIVLDCRYSTAEWIKQSILQSDLPTILKFEERDIDWQQALQYATKTLMSNVVGLFNDGFSVSDIVRKTNISETAVRGLLHTATKIGVCNYDPKESKQKQYDAIKKQVLCIELNKVFPSLIDAGTFIGHVDGSNVSKCCRGVAQTAGGYHWKYIV